MGGLRIGSVFGIDLALHASLLVISILIATSLGFGVLPAWHPEWGAALVWAVALTATVGLFLSILVHELSHALVGRAFGIPVKRITLFLFGGVANMEREPPTPGSELLMALAGPATSFVLGVLLLTGGFALLDGTVLPAEAIEQAGAAPTIFLWLGSVNVTLAVFNLVPGFPLDGGRALRAVLWSATGNLRQATRLASWGGQLFGWFLIGCGIAMAFGVRLPVFGTGALSGLWLVLIGWFLRNAAEGSYQGLVIDETLRQVPIRRLVRPSTSVTPDLPVSELVSDFLMATDQHAFPVTDGVRVLGVVSLVDIRKIPREAWERTPVRHIMTEVEALDVDEDGALALRKLAEGSVDQLPVQDHGHLEGVVRREDLLKWLALRDVDLS